ncbi:hypothetical protein [Gilvimarinus sp. DA14]|uniref:Nmad3 family putative nucleotide modification protein n=1 Tax=Gilvimarinus sp. DA14 TaxID=2956798 RepID=UPI0020B7A3BE|nr:hypothetical protein [Gilvimarinus sp. DA14]UTF61106.1 hypothetical protein NHM04_04710 [Gilvimarinus sp. DA14]
MKLILSRKGFDSSAGGFPSPIFPDGQLLSLPIPDRQGPTSYADIHTDWGPMADILAQLSGKTHWHETAAHIDPDLRRNSLARRRGWQATLGQTGTAQSHLRNQNVAEGDIFIFFGLFKPVEKTAQGWRFVQATMARHVIWGWLQIGKIHPVDQLNPSDLPWCRYHPHMHLGEDANNTLYQAARALTLNNVATPLPGAGVCQGYRPELSLTAPDATTPSQWELPAHFFPHRGKPALSYHRKPERWHKCGNRLKLQAAARGQEFVLDTDFYPEAQNWLSALLLPESAPKSQAQ